MKTKFFISGLFIVLMVSLTLILTENNASADISKGPLVTVTLTGNGNTNANVFIKNTSTGTIYYIQHIGGGVYQQQSGLPDGNYHVYACTQYPSYGSVLNQTIDPPTYINVTIPLTGGICPFGND